MFYFGNESVNYAEDSFGEAAEQKQTSPSPTPPSPLLSKVSPVHPRTAMIFPFLDLMTDFFLKAKNPNSSYTNATLMPGYDGIGCPIKSKPSKIFENTSKKL